MASEHPIRTPADARSGASRVLFAPVSGDDAVPQGDHASIARVATANFGGWHVHLKSSHAAEAATFARISWPD